MLLSQKAIHRQVIYKGMQPLQNNFDTKQRNITLRKGTLVMTYMFENKSKYKIINRSKMHVLSLISYILVPLHL